MAKQANTSNEPTQEHVRDAVTAIEANFEKMLELKMEYMKSCKGFRHAIADEYDSASNRGISKKLLKQKIKERGLLKKIDDMAKALEADEISEYEMLSEKLGEFAETPLGAAALNAAKHHHGGDGLRSVGL